MLYPHLRSRGVEEGVAGPIIFKANLKIEVEANKRVYKLEENSPVERAYMVGLHVTKAGTIVDETKTQAAGAIFDSAYLEIMVNTTKVLMNLYLHQVAYANEQGRPYYLYLPGRINLSESSLIVPKNDTIAANTVFELQVDYAKPKS